MEYYSWILAFHVMSFISWMAMLFYQPRLFVYHSENGDNEGFVQVVQRQEYILNKAIGTPAMWATIITGGIMLYLNPAIFQSGGWMHAKLLFLIFLITYHFSLEILRKKLLDNAHYKSGKWFRFYNEVPTLLMIVIVIMVVVKPI
ncbi:MAG TPA: protoporphyrinogen oxidase HemJ [Sulfurovum sp.]|nr:protoporphyrinogen oxidase HemJ [Sulfurovum sp.]